MSMEILYETLHCLFCGSLAAYLAVRTARQTGHLRLYAVTGAAVCLMLGDVYWLIHLIIRGETPQMFSACDVAYLGTWLMLGAGLPRGEESTQGRRPFAALMGVFAVLNGIGWGFWTGDWLSDVLWTIPMLMVVVRSALRVEVELRSARGMAFLGTLTLLVLGEMTWYVVPERFWTVCDCVCDLLWALSLVQMACMVKGRTPFRQLSFPAWLLLIFFAEYAALLATGWVYFAFQVIVAVAVGCMAMSVCREGEASYAV